jgi:hypothetical protein
MDGTNATATSQIEMQARNPLLEHDVIAQDVIAQDVIAQDVIAHDVISNDVILRRAEALRRTLRARAAEKAAAGNTSRRML